MNESISELKRRIAELERAQRRAQGASPSRGLLTALAAFVLVLAGIGYGVFGNPQGWNAGPGEPAAVQADHDGAQFEAMAARLAARLKERPEDAEGWAMLARTYLVLQRFDASVPAFRRAAQLSPDDAGLYADWADALAMVNGRRLAGEAERLIEQALKIDADNVKARSLAGSVAFERGDYRVALEHWERGLRAAEPGSEAARRLQAVVGEARERAGIAAAPAARTTPMAAGGDTKVSGEVRLADAARDKVSPDDTVFVFARPADGGRVPLAIVRTTVRALPYRFTLDDSTAMNPQQPLSSAGSVIVGARISKSGQATPRTGDLQGFSPPVKVGQGGVQVEIGEVVR